MALVDPESPIHAVLAFCKALEISEIKYLIGGSFASSVHGEYRATNDIDYLVNFSGVDLDRFFESLKADFIFDDLAIRNAIKISRPFNIIHESTFVKIDVFTRVTAYQRLELERAQKIDLPGTEVKVLVATAEDIILTKLSWFKLGNEVATQQWRDILGVIKVQGDRLDRKYLESQAENLDISMLLVKALQQA